MTGYPGRGFVAVTLALIALFCELPMCAQQNQDSLAFVRAQHPQRGINATQWFSNWKRDYSVQRLETYTTPEDIALMAAVGFDHVRLDIDLDALSQWLTQSQWGQGTSPSYKTLKTDSQKGSMKR